jgi:hypothetical protein
MTFARWTGSAWTSLATHNRWTGSAWTAIAQARRWTGSVWQVFGFLSATLAPTALNGTRVGIGNVQTSGSCTTTPINGSGSYTYVWNITTTLGNTVSATNPTSATSFFFATLTSLQPESDASATCTVTDTVSGLVVTTTNNVLITLTHS